MKIKITIDDKTIEIPEILNAEKVEKIEETEETGIKIASNSDVKEEYKHFKITFENKTERMLTTDGKVELISFPEIVETVEQTWE